MIKKLLVTVCMSSAFVFTATAQFDMSGEVKKEKSTKNDATSPDKDTYSEIQKKYQNQIVFSKSKIKKNEENASSFVNTWQMGEPLFFRMYHAQTLKELVYDYSKKQNMEFDKYAYADYAEHTVVFINGKEMATYERATKDENRVNNWVTGSGTVFDLGDENYVSGNIPVAIARVFHALGSNFKEGTYELDIKVYAVPNTLSLIERDKSERVALMSSGKLTVKATKEGINKYAKFLCRDLLKRESTLSDPALENEIVQLYSKDWGVKALAASIIDADWTIKRNNLGAILCRTISANLVYTDKDGGTTMLLFVVKQDYDGSGYQKTIKSFNRSDYRPYCPFCVEYKKTQ